MGKARVRRTGYLLCGIGASTWATNGIVSSLLFSSHAITATELAAARMYGGALLLGVGAFAAVRRLPRRALGRLALFGIFGMSAPQWLFYLAIARINVPIALVIVYTAPALVTAWERVRNGVRLPAAAVAAIIVAIVGVAVAVLGAPGGVGSYDTLGLLFACAAMVSYCMQIVLAATQPVELTPFQKIGGALLFAVLAWLVVMPFWSLPFDAITHGVQLGTRTTATLPMGALAGYVILFGTVIAYALLVAGASRIGAGAAAVTGMIEPVIASVLAWAVLGQSLAPLQVAGIAVALGGVTAAEVLRGRGRPGAETLFAA